MGENRPVHTAEPLVSRFLDVLGLQDVKYIRSLRLDMQPQDLVVAVVEIEVWSKALEDLLPVLEQYELVRKEPSNG